MKKALSNSTPSKLSRKVLSRTSNSSSLNDESKTNQLQPSTSKTVKNEKDSATLETELTSLRNQISSLQLAVQNMQDDAEKKEKALAHIAREKQQLYIDLRKERRSSTDLKQQLQDEREFYFKEKEQYCQEMNDCKKLKQKISEDIESVKKDAVKEESAEIIKHKEKISMLQDTLNQTLQSNYNLSLKFFRMKNTKSFLKMQLQQQEEEHRQAMQNLQTTVNNIKNDLADVVDKRFTLPISPSNKKYLQVIKQNGMLMYENLCLQMEVDRLNAEIKYHKCSDSRREAKRRLKQAHSSPQQNISMQDDLKYAFLEHQSVTDTLPRNQTKSEDQIQKQQRFLNIARNKQQRARNFNLETQKFENLKDPESKTTVVTIFERASDSTTECCSEVASNDYPQKIKQQEGSKAFELSKLPLESQTISTRYFTAASQASSHVTRTESNTLTCTSSSSQAFRTQSAPEIFQTSLFISKHKS